jgi:hypothetical protein
VRGSGPSVHPPSSLERNDVEAGIVEGWRALPPQVLLTPMRRDLLKIVGQLPVPEKTLRTARRKNTIASRHHFFKYMNGILGYCFATPLGFYFILRLATP